MAAQYKETARLDPWELISYLDEIRMNPNVTIQAPCPPDEDVRTRTLPVDLAHLAKALGHPARVHILKVLLAKDACIAGELSEELPLAASTVSQHLKILKDAGFIKGEVDGPRRCYCVDKSVLDRFKNLVRTL